MQSTERAENRGWRERLFTVIFEADTRAGRLFDLALLVLILLSVVIVMLESVPGLEARYGWTFNIIEWTLTFLFTVEYILRLYCVRSPMQYARSFYGLVDLLAILPSFLSLLLPQTRFLLVIRSLRLMRVFRILKLTHFVREGRHIVQSLKASIRRIFVFLVFVLLLSVILGAMVYVVESQVNSSFSSIPQSVYWAIVTITTVGYGDISPVTPVGKSLASLIMLLGYGILAVPTGIVTMELSKKHDEEEKMVTRHCTNCSNETHDPDAKYCKKCGSRL
jgi:voltage-gated potassium channel